MFELLKDRLNAGRIAAAVLVIGMAVFLLPPFAHCARPAPKVKTARKYGIDYALKKDCTEEPPKYFVFFKAKSAEVLTMAFKEFSANELTKSKKTPNKEKLRSLSAQVKSKNKERSREKSKSREAEL